MSASQDEVIKEFVRELQSILDARPPISKAKMISITKTALKAVKFYKHIVMNVEKFISKCKPEYKIPGLYVIDSVIRQSRHQYGIEKDVYGARFAKNILVTLQNVDKCPSEDKNKITRVLNLWQKNSIFPTDLLKQLFEVHQTGLIDVGDSSLLKSGDKSIGSGDFDRFRALQETLMRASNKGDADTTTILTEIQHITNQLLEAQKKSTTTGDEPSSTTTLTINPTEFMQSNVANVLDDFDYGSDNDDDEPRRPIMTHAAPSFGSGIPQQQIQYIQPPPDMLLNANPSNTISFPLTDANNMSVPMSFDPSRPPPIFYQQPLPPSFASQQQIIQQQPDYSNSYGDRANNRRIPHEPNDVDLRPEDMESDSYDDHQHQRHHYSSNNRRRSRSRSRSREPKRSRSSSNSTNKRDAAASRLKETERRERRRKGLPPLKEDHLVVSSRTLWLGHLPKMISEIDLREHLEPHGEITDINNIPPRGCAFVCFKERSDAARCLEKMKDFRFQGNPIKIAWATSKGVKDRFKDFWDADHGCTYVPYSELKDIANLTALAEGGTIDEESMPAFLRPIIPVHHEVPSLVHHQPQPPTLLHPQPTFGTNAFATSPNMPPVPPGVVHLESPNRLAPSSTAAGPTLMMQPPHESPIRVGVPVQMMPHGTQLIQVQQHPQQVQVVQRITGRMLPNGQIVHQMPFGHVLATSQPGGTIQLQHHHADLKDLNAQAMSAGPTLIQFRDESQLQQQQHHHHRSHRLSPSPAILSHQFDDHHRHLSSTDEQLLRISNASSSSSRFQPHFSSLPGGPTPLLGESTSPIRHHHPHHGQFGGVATQPPSLLAIPTTNDEHAQAVFPRRPSRFEDRGDVPQLQDNNAAYLSYRGGRTGFNDRGGAGTMSRGGGGDGGSGRGRGGGGGGRGFFNNNDRGGRMTAPDNNESGGYRGRGGHNRGGRGGFDRGNQSRFSSRGGGSGRHDYSSSHSPDRRQSSSHDGEKHSSSSSLSSGFSAPPVGSFDEHSLHRSIPSEALRKLDKSNFDSISSSNDSNNNLSQSALIVDETAGGHNG